MDINNLYSLEKVKGKLIDQESLSIFEARMQYSFNRDELTFYNHIITKHATWSTIRGFDYFYSQFPEGQKIVLFGSGDEGRQALDILTHSKYVGSVFAFCDNNEALWGTTIASLPVISPDNLLSQGKYLVVITSRKNVNTIYESLIWRGYPYQRIFYPPLRFFYATRAEQIYFDVFAPQKDEIFVDAGCCDGNTIFQFIKWCEGDYKSIYAFEPSKENYNRCAIALKDITKCKLINKGVWSKKDMLSFNQNPVNPGGSKIADNGNSKVPVIDIDSVLNGNPATFIKMDVEGSELEALRGAKETIMRFHPRMAISLYHKPEDVFEIPTYILQLNSEYKFYLRHYSSGIWETILYAI